jgi:sporulation protein YlmC with PRC-barrel domain
MRNLITVVTVLSLVGFVLIPGALAQIETTPGTNREPTVDRPSQVAPTIPPGEKASPKPSTTLATSKEWYTSDLIGATVKNPEGENLGSIRELVLDPQEAKIKDAVVAMGGVLGIGSKLVAIPWKEVTPQADGKTVIVAMGKAELQDAPDWRKPIEETMPPARGPTTAPTVPRSGALDR